MKYLFDCDALLALGYAEHANHVQAGAFYAKHHASQFLTTPITELAFIRIGTQAGYFASVANAQAVLTAIKTAFKGRIAFLPDDFSAETLPVNVTRPRDTTDGHLLALARHHGSKLVTFDTGIPGAVLVA